ncbi:MAG: hypothetical protein WAY02_09390 [Burkholderiaceae bacterium]
MGLRYIGTDRATDWIPGVPARDLSDEEVALYPAAAESVLYEDDTAPRQGDAAEAAETPEQE